MTEADPLMIFRVLEYVVLLYRSQVREWGRQHDSLSGFRFQPVLPVVFYTGLTAWSGLGTFADLLADHRHIGPGKQMVILAVAASIVRIHDGSSQSGG